MIIILDWMESRIMLKKPENGKIKMNMHKLRTVGHCRQYDRYTKRRKKCFRKFRFQFMWHVRAWRMCAHAQPPPPVRPPFCRHCHHRHPIS